MHRTEL